MKFAAGATMLEVATAPVLFEFKCQGSDCRIVNLGGFIRFEEFVQGSWQGCRKDHGLVVLSAAEALVGENMRLLAELERLKKKQAKDLAELIAFRRENA